MGFKQSGFPIHSGTNNHTSALKKVEESALKQKSSWWSGSKQEKIDITKPKEDKEAKATDWASIHEKAKAKDPRYGKLSLEEYTAEAKRQSAHYKKTGKWDAMGVYDKEGKKKTTEKKVPGIGGPEKRLTKTQKTKEKAFVKSEKQKKIEAKVAISKRKRGDVDPKTGTVLSRAIHKRRAKRLTKKLKRKYGVTEGDETTPVKDMKTGTYKQKFEKK